MDSKLVQAGILIVTLFTATVLIIVLAVNNVFNPKKQQVNSQIEDTIIEEEIVPEGSYSAWMNDETFFDEIKLADGKYEVEESDIKDVTYMTSVIGKDIRVVVLDDQGDLIKGRKFEVGLAGLGTYSDNNRDGIITIEDVPAGEYSLSLAELKGYRVPEGQTTVKVNAKIEYKAVADISYLIKTEADIDAAKEDTAKNDAAEETTGSSAIKTVEGALFGIDVSKWNGDINWSKVKDEGVKYAIIRCGYRGSKTGAIVEDPYFRQNIEGAIQADIPVGIYFFTQAVNESEAIEEASAVMSLIREYKVDYPVFVDSESAGGKGRADELDIPQRSKALQAFCETIRSGGYTAGIYASKNWFNNRLDLSKLSADNVTWLAEYADKATFGATYQMWQYSSAGRIPGIEGRVDMNLSYLDISGNGKAKNNKIENSTESTVDNTNEKATEEKKDDSAEKKRITSKESKEDGQVNSRDM